MRGHVSYLPVSFDALDCLARVALHDSPHAHVLQRETDEPNAQDLIYLRDQLTNAINELQGTKDMVQKARAGRAAPTRQPLK